ncbi:MAG: TonB-dependent receptor, partial [Bryobacteraceae bacterium]
IDPLGPSSTLPIDRAQNRFRYGGRITRVNGRHTLIAGADFARLQVNGGEASSNRGVLYFRSEFGRDAMTNLRLGTPSRFSTGIGELVRGFRSWERQLFAGDNWRVHRNLTLNYGIRYQPITAPVEVNRLTEIPYHCDCNNVAPRFGFAYRLPDRWGVLRGAYGVQFGDIFPVTFQQLRWDPPNFHKIEVQAPNLVNPLRDADLRPTARSTIFVVPPTLRTPYSHQYNFSWEAPTGTKWKLQLGYVGSRTQKLLMMWFTNRPLDIPGIPLTTETINLRRPDPNHFEVRRVENSSRAYFDAARISLVLPAWHGLAVDTAYWFSKAIDLGGAYTNTAAGDDAKQGRSQSESLVSEDLKGPSAFDQSHSFLARVTYLTPSITGRAAVRRILGRWSLSAVLLAKTGSPFTVFSGSDGPGFGNVDGSSSDRPNLLDPSILGRIVGHPDTSRLLLPRSAFGFIRPTDVRGNLGVGTFRRAGIHNVNAGVSRSWTLGSDRSLSLRAESINFFNSPQFAEPGTDVTSPSFGQITNTLNDGRTFQFQLRLRF